MAKKGKDGTKPPRQGQPFHVPADIRAAGSDPDIIIRLRREYYVLGRNLPGGRKGK